MPLRTKIIAGVLIFLTAAAVIAILYFPSERTTNIVAVAALLVTTAKAGYDIYEKELERRTKAEDSREKIVVTPKYGIWDTTSPHLGVEIYNAGPSPVSIESVVCQYVPSGSKDVKTLALTSMKVMRTELVPSKHHGKFRLESFDIDLVGEMGKLRDKDVWITVKTHEGAAVMVDGREIIRVLNSPPTSQHG